MRTLLIRPIVALNSSGATRDCSAHGKLELKLLLRPKLRNGNRYQVNEYSARDFGPLTRSCFQFPGSRSVPVWDRAPQGEAQLPPAHLRRWHRNQPLLLLLLLRSRNQQNKTTIKSIDGGNIRLSRDCNILLTSKLERHNKTQLLFTSLGLSARATRENRNRNRKRKRNLKRTKEMKNEPKNR